ncbi:peptidylprolyl isomerase, partial [Pseudomonas sp. RTB3]|nr:peptidylprolyl isomerase [Pseudomonas sp. RTB3]
ARDSGSNPCSSISFTREVQPIFTVKCVACHACYDAACLLNLGSADGALRGASKFQVYNVRRSDAEAPTRLYYDAHSVTAWQ